MLATRRYRLYVADASSAGGVAYSGLAPDMRGAAGGIVPHGSEVAEGLKKECARRAVSPVALRAKHQRVMR